MRAIRAALDGRRHRERAVDVLVAEYVRWREESLGVHRAYERWAIAPPRERGLAHAAYLAALDREGEAAATYACRIEAIAQ